MAKISKKRFIDICEECGIYPERLPEDSLVAMLYAELNKSKNKWIPWAGGKCPVDRETIVRVKFRDGDISTKRQADVWIWKHTCYNGDIIAYKVIDNQ